MAGAAGDEKPCVVCGRRITWRRKWARDWEQVKYCSAACRKRGHRPIDQALENAIMTLLARRARGATLCPSEAARQVAPDNWRPLMEASRAAARRLVDQGVVEITQQGRRVDPSTARGPIRVRRLTDA